MAHSTLWWLIAGGTLVVEMLSGTVYLLLLSGGFAAAAVSAHLGAAPTTQFIVAALVGSALVLGWKLMRRRQPPAALPSSSPDLNLDIGERVQVQAWSTDGTAQVRHRGAQWTVVLAPGSYSGPGDYRVIEVVGSRLVVQKI